MELEKFSYDNKIVKAFFIATVIFGLVGMLVGLTAAIQLFYPIFNFSDSPVGQFVSFGRIRPLHTNAIIFAFVGNAMFAGGIRPHAYCLPVAKREKHRLALRKAATSGSPKFFLGTDSAPHSVSAKESACGCAGIFNAPFALESYAAVFDEDNALDKLEGFASELGPTFYGLPLNAGTVTLERAACPVPETVEASGTTLVPFHAAEVLAWRLVSS